MDYRNLKLPPEELSRASDRISFLYVERARIEQTNYGVKIIEGDRQTDVPVTNFLCLMLGPGTSITHRAVANVAAAGCSIVWCGENGFTFYAFGRPLTDSAKNTLKQMRLHENKGAHIAVIRKMYKIRYPDLHAKSKPVDVLRGEEGRRVKALYEELSRKHQIEWDGRKYDTGDFDSQDAINKSLTYANQILYAVVKAVINALGFCPSIGFIHTGHMDSFVYDIADLYKENFSIPIAFECAKDGDFNRELIRRRMHDYIAEKDWIGVIVKDIENMFDIDCQTQDNSNALKLWDTKSFVDSSVNYGK